MRLGGIYLKATQQCLIHRVWSADNSRERMRGLLGHPRLQMGEGMLIGQCRIVHTVGMRYPLDLAFLDRSGQICKLLEGVLPLRIAGSMSASATLELAAGILSQLSLCVGDNVEWREHAL